MRSAGEAPIGSSCRAPGWRVRGQAFPWSRKPFSYFFNVVLIFTTGQQGDTCCLFTHQLAIFVLLSDYEKRRVILPLWLTWCTSTLFISCLKWIVTVLRSSLRDRKAMSSDIVSELVRRFESQRNSAVTIAIPSLKYSVHIQRLFRQNEEALPPLACSWLHRWLCAL